MRIVLVEPSRLGLKIMTNMLRDIGRDVVPFQDGGEALERIRSDLTVAMVMTSLETPTISGLQLCWEAKALCGSTRPIYAIAMSSYYDNERLTGALDSGADDYVTKPPNRQELSARVRAGERIVAAQRQLIRLATVDALTDLLNRRAFMERATRALIHGRNTGKPVVMMMVDADHFKKVNDVHGHDVGDDVLRGIGAILKSMAPISGRLGGEEFGIVLEGMTLSEAAIMAEILRHRVTEYNYGTSSRTLHITASIGMDIARPDDSLKTLMKRTDQALFAAKHGGRNRVVVATTALFGDELPRQDSNVIAIDRGMSVA